MGSALQNQIALETAMRDAIRALGYKDSECDRMYNGEPPPRCPSVFVAVWSDNSRESQSRMSLDELFKVMVTITVRFTRPFDKWLEHRDDLIVRANAIRVLGHKDSLDWSISKRANGLANYAYWSPTNANADKVVGFCEPLMYEGMDSIRDVGADWFHAAVGEGRPLEVGAAQTLRFTGARHKQNMATMV